MKNARIIISFVENFYVLPKIIMEMVKTFLPHNNKHSIRSVSHFWKNENLCILKSDQIYISTYNNSEYFKSIYILCYKNFEDFKNLSSDEFKCLSKLSDIKEYLNLRKVKDYTANIQKIYGDNESSIGRLIIPNNYGSKNETCPNTDFSINKIEFNKTINTNRSSSIPKNISSLSQSLNPLINIGEKINAIKNEDYINSNKKHRNNSIRTNKNKNINILENMSKEIQKKGNLKENKDNEILIKQNAEFKSIIKNNEIEINKIKNLNVELQEQLKVEKEKNNELEKIIKNLEQKSKENEEQNEIKGKEKDKKIENLLSLNKNLEEEKNNLEEKYQKLNKKYEKLNEEYENQKKDNKPLSLIKTN